jgi:hypothetical protein
LSAALIETGLLSEEEVLTFLSLAADPESYYVPPFLTAAWGRRA